MTKQEAITIIETMLGVECSTIERNTHLVVTDGEGGSSVIDRGQARDLASAFTIVADSLYFE